MDKYKVKVNPRAISELDHIYEYIANEKSASENAKGQIDRIKNAILSLDTFPQSHQERNEGRYARKGYRQLLIDKNISIKLISNLDSRFLQKMSTFGIIKSLAKRTVRC